MAARIIELIQGSDDWKNYRKNKISATDSGIILGLNPWVTPYQLWQRKLGLIEEQPINDKMREGSLMESDALFFFNKEKDTDFKPCVVESTEYPFAMASLDGIASDGFILEIKCGKASHEMALKHETPPYYYSQLQHQMMVTNTQFVGYFSYRADDDNIYRSIARDDDFIEKMIEAETKFFDCLMNFSSPDLIDRDYVIKDDYEFKTLADWHKSIKLQKTKLEVDEAFVREKLIKLCEDKLCKGAGITVSKSVRRGNIDYSAIPELKSIDLNKYRKKNLEVWTIRES